MCIGLKERCAECGKLTKQVVTHPCKAGSSHEAGYDLLACGDGHLQCNAGSVDYTERTISNCTPCFKSRRSEKMVLLQLVKQVLEAQQHELSRPYWPSDDVSHEDPKRARLARVIQAERTDVAVSLRHVSLQLNALKNALRGEESEVEPRRVRRGHNGTNDELFDVLGDFDNLDSAIDREANRFFADLELDTRR